MAYIFVWVYIFIQICAVGSKTRIFSASKCILAVQGHSGSSKVDDFGINRKRIYDFLLVINSNVGSILHRFGDTATYWLKVAYFSYPSLTLIRRPRSLGSPWNFTLKLITRKLESWGYLHYSEDSMIVAWVVLTQWQTDRQTDGFSIVHSAL